MMRKKDVPLVELAEGADQDDRASLLAAFNRVLPEKPATNNLHVRELLTYVLQLDRSGRGISLTYRDVERILLCSYSTARTVVDRAVSEFGLLSVCESRYVTGGQKGNMYSIDWDAVRAVNSVDEKRENATFAERKATERAPQEPGACQTQPPACQTQGAVCRKQPPAPDAHPYKEHTLSSSLSNTLTTTGVDESTLDGWEVVVRDLKVLKVTLAKRAVDLARERGLSIEDCTELIAVYRQHHREHPQPAWLYRWFTGESRPPDPKPPPNRSHPRGDALSPEEQRKASLRTRIVQQGRAKGASEQAIAEACRRNGVEY